MKRLILKLVLTLLIIIGWNSNVFAQVPDTNTFSLQSVVTEVIPSSDDLVQCFVDAEAVKFDPSHEGSKNNLLNFRNYGNGTSVTAFPQNNLSFSTSVGACGDSGGSTTKWHDGGGATPIAGDKVFTDAGGFTPFNGGSQWFQIADGFLAILIDTAGTVLQLIVC